MNYIVEKLNTPVAGEYDVIVAGGGPAGVSAASAAAENGAKTLVVEQFGFFGGMWTAGLVNPMFDTHSKGSIVKKLVDLLKENNSWGGFEGISFDYEMIKAILDKLVIRSGADILFHSHISKTYMEGGQVKGIIVENKSGRSLYRSKVVIDCTGDGDAAAYAGAEYSYGRETDGLTQPMTLMFKLGNIHYTQADRDQLYKLITKAISDNNLDYKLSYKHPYIIMLPGSESAVVQMIHLKGLSGVNAVDLTKAEIAGRKEAMEIYRLFRQYIPEFSNITLEQTASHIGVRESRRIKGVYTLTLDDVLNGRKFDDGIALCTFPVDIHQPDKDGQSTYFPQPYHIPYRCLVPEKIDGLLVAGRCISGTHEAHASYRVTGNCMAMGEAAGIAAAIAVRDGVNVRDIDTGKLLAKLRENGAVL